MGSSGLKIDVELVRREKVNDHDSYITGEVVRVERSGLSRDQIVIAHPVAGGRGERTISLAFYYITATVFHHALPGCDPLTVPHELDEASQNRAFKVLEGQFGLGVKRGKAEGGRSDTPTGESKGETVSRDRGPRRVEVILKNTSDPTEEVRLVAIDVSPPAGHFKNYTVLGRVWRGQPKTLQKAMECFWATTHTIRRIEAFHQTSSGTSYSRHFNESESLHQAWVALAREMRRLTDRERELVRAWDPEDSDDRAAPNEQDDDSYDFLFDFYPGRDIPTARGRFQHTHTVHPRTPDAAHYRVAGDNIGIRLFREQIERAKEISVGAKVNARPEEDEEEPGVEERRASDNPRSQAASYLARLCPTCNGLRCGQGRCFRDSRRSQLPMLPATVSRRTH